MTLNLPRNLDTTIQIAEQAGTLPLEGWGSADGIEVKGEVDVGTMRDRRSETLIVSALRTTFPDHHIVAEEQGQVGPLDSPHARLIDPLDGTTNFAHGFPVFAVSMAHTYHGRELVGAVLDPLRPELFTAAAGLGARLNHTPIAVSSVNALDRALLGTGFAYDRRTASDNNVENLAQFIRRCQGIRRVGAAALDLAYVACGRLDGFWQMGLQPWDVAASALLVREAGGSITDPDGRQDNVDKSWTVASNGLIHDQMLGVLRGG